jgi:hypothetical protein
MKFAEESTGSESCRIKVAGESTGCSENCCMKFAEESTGCSENYRINFAEKVQDVLKAVLLLLWKVQDVLKTVSCKYYPSLVGCLLSGKMNSGESGI